MKNMQKGFTLIELMIVVAIIAILAAIAIPAYQDYVIRSQVSEGMSLADGAKTSVAEFYSNKGYLPKTNGSAGLSAAHSIGGNYVNNVEVTNTGLIKITYGKTGTGTFGNKANKAIKNAVLDLSARPSVGSIAWTCKPEPTLKSKYLPASCR